MIGGPDVINKNYNRTFLEAVDHFAASPSIILMVFIDMKGGIGRDKGKAYLVDNLSKYLKVNGL